MNIFVICPVRNVTEEETKLIDSYVAKLEEDGHDVHWPPRDTNQVDSIGLRICQDNRYSIAEADEIHIYWNKNSSGSLFDVGMAFALQKTIKLFNRDGVEETPHKSFNNVLLALDAKARK